MHTMPMPYIAQEPLSLLKVKCVFVRSDLVTTLVYLLNCNECILLQIQTIDFETNGIHCWHSLLNRLPIESKGKKFVTFVYGIRLLNLEERCPLREDLPLDFRENYLQEVKIPLPTEEFTSNY